MNHKHADVIVMGGGPAGSTLAALLRRRTDLSVMVLDKEHFPREHIGESFAHPVVPVLEQSGALGKVLASECWVKKYGGVFRWDDGDPAVAYFDHTSWESDGVHRWSMHVDRARFDEILLRHAESCGAQVVEGARVASVDLQSSRDPVITLVDGSTLTCSLFVDASGRQNKRVTGRDREWLSTYRNVAIWQHFTGGEFVQQLPGEWNIFREQNMSPIGCFAFDDGWCWYIPVPKIINGERRLTHSVGIVTNPDVLQQQGKDLTDPEVFLATVKSVPMLESLIRDAEPVRPGVLTATNYSMINDTFCDRDQRWMLVGDAAYFVDPLFSSGVAFATTQASAAALVIERTLTAATPEIEITDLWHDYDVEWRAMAETFSLSIDQWYHAISANNPDSTYWRSRGSSPDLGIRKETFQALLNTAITPDLLHLMTKGTDDVADLEASGPFMSASHDARRAPVSDDDVVTLAEDAAVRSGPGLDVPGFKGAIPPPPFVLPPPLADAIARYWQNPLAHGPHTPSPTDGPVDCLRLTGSSGTVRSVPLRDGGDAIWSRLSAGPVRVVDLVSGLPPAARALVDQLRFAGVIEPDGAVASTPAVRETASSAVVG